MFGWRHRHDSINRGSSPRPMMIKPQLPLESHLSPSMLHSMDSIDQQKLHALVKSWRSHPLKGSFQILLSIYLLSLFFMPYPSWVPTNRKSLKPTISASISNLLSIDVNRNLMFLIFNALLFVVTRGFGFFGFSSNAVEEQHDEYLARRAAYHRSAPIEDEEIIAESLVLEENGVPGIEVEEEGEAVVEEEAAPKVSAAYHRSAPIEDKEVIAESLILVENGVPGIEVEEEGEAVVEEEAAPKGSAAYHRSAPIEDKEVIAEILILVEDGVPRIEVEGEAVVVEEEAPKENHYRQQHQLQLYHHRRSHPREEAAPKENHYRQQHQLQLYHHRCSRPHDHEEAAPKENHYRQQHQLRLCHHRRSPPQEEESAPKESHYRHQHQLQFYHHRRSLPQEEAAAPKENHYRQQHQLQLYHRRASRPHGHDHHLHHYHYPRLRQLRKEEEEDGQENYSHQKQQDERSGLVLTEESDERFDNFIERVKEGMRMEARQLLLMG